MIEDDFIRAYVDPFELEFLTDEEALELAEERDEESADKFMASLDFDAGLKASKEVLV